MARYGVHISTCSHGSFKEVPSDTVHGFKRKIYVGMFCVGTKKQCDDFVKKWSATNSHMVGLTFEVRNLESDIGAANG